MADDTPRILNLLGLPATPNVSRATNQDFRLWNDFSTESGLGSVKVQLLGQTVSLHPAEAAALGARLLRTSERAIMFATLLRVGLELMELPLQEALQLANAMSHGTAAAHAEAWTREMEARMAQDTKMAEEVPSGDDKVN